MEAKHPTRVRSEINKFTPSTSHEEEIHPANVVLQDVVEKIFWLKSGYYEGSSSSCKSSTAPDSIQNFLEERVEYWKNFLNKQKGLERKIMNKTGKDKSELLMNFIVEHRRIQLVKRIMDYAERLRPDKLIVRKEFRNELRNPDPCAESIYETLPISERTGIAALTIADVAKAICEEEDIDLCKIRNSSWLRSKYLAERLFCKAEDIRRILLHFPEIDELYIRSLKVDLQEKQKEFDWTPKDSSQVTSSSINFQVTLEDVEESEQTHEYVIQLNEHVLDVEKKHVGNINIDIVCESHQFEKTKIIMLTLQNCGWKAIDFYWNRYVENVDIQERSLHKWPAFHFDKNTFRLIPGKNIQFRLLFCAKDPGIYTEKWLLFSNPSFFVPGYSFVLNLFGHCKEDKNSFRVYEKMYEDLFNRAGKNMTTDLLNIVSIQAVPEPKPKAPYISQFTEKEIFTNLYPDINYSEAGMEKLKALYKEANIAIKCRCCPEWNYDIDGLKNQILSIDNEVTRKKLYFQLIDIIKEMRCTPLQSKSLYHEHKFLLVKSVIISTMDKIDSIAEQLRVLMIKSEFPLDFDEVLVLNTQKKPLELKSKSKLSSASEEQVDGNTVGGQIKNEEEHINYLNESEEEESIEDPAAVIKSEYVRKKQKQLFMDSLYMQVFAHLGNAAEEIAGVIEGAKNLF